MKDMVNERLLLLSTAQESLMDIADILDQWEISQRLLEKNSFDLLNVSDRILDLAKEGNQLSSKLQNYSEEISQNQNEKSVEKTIEFINEIEEIIRNLHNVAKSISEVSHNLELEVVSQKEIEDELKDAVDHVSKSVDSAVACAEMVLAEI
ncbi:hypothetical protein H0486_14785 [Lachnospiraceae bacterium MD1]|jgi:methyl-accepting chemotaxis protein|uniref:Methyl-accepting transducer domain-containing protein n=1 Tax=Variimorphobacter saccharofermentans TaxID=2755051 RepID=A0A839K2K1_9FIRM|nr:hypothetical protein [Variimorphobacter saccharofermentans]MBB2184143.1 hypothetical protein [Variimorphobacter saccharofermentans]